MICEKCSHESPEGTSYCPSCGKRLVDREWTISGWLVAIAAACLVLLGAGGTWLAVARHRSPPAQIPMPTVAVMPDAVKPSPAVNTDTNSDSQDTSEVFKNFALPKNTAVTKVQPRPESKSKSDTARNQPAATAVAPNKIRVSRSFGPVQFQLPAHRKIVNPFSVPDGLSDAHFRAMIASAGGFGGHLRVVILRDKTPVFDSGNSFQSKVDIPITSGSYSLVIENTAIALPRSIMIQGTISGVRR